MCVGASTAREYEAFYERDSGPSQRQDKTPHVFVLASTAALLLHGNLIASVPTGRKNSVQKQCFSFRRPPCAWKPFRV